MLDADIDTRNTPYDRTFYETLGAGSARSAHIVLGMLFDRTQPTSVVDVGCGEGPWLAAAMRLGVQDVLGLDGDYVDRARLQIPADCFVATDLSRSFGAGRRFDLAICMEVAEHLDSSSADGFIANLVSLAPVVLFSAAVPGQGGTDHRNEQWPSYWAALFAKHRYACLDAFRPRIWHDDRIDVWYRQNTLLFVAHDHPLRDDPVFRSTVIDRPMDVMHEQLAAAGRGQLERRLYWAEHPGIRAAARSLLAAFIRRIRGVPVR